MSIVVPMLLAINIVWLLCAILIKPSSSVRLYRLFGSDNGSKALFIFTLIVVATTFATV